MNYSGISDPVSCRNGFRERLGSLLEKREAETNVCSTPYATHSPPPGAPRTAKRKDCGSSKKWVSIYNPTSHDYNNIND